MSQLLTFYIGGTRTIACNSSAKVFGRLAFSSASQKPSSRDEEEFRVLDFSKKRQQIERKYVKRDEVRPPRADKMKTDQNWGNVWPGPRSFHPASVPLPLRQGYMEKNDAPPAKYANAELMKIPNFLHLTPPAIKQQCEALKQFCTPWPKGLASEETIEEHYPLEVITSDYCHASPSIRNPLARIVSLRIKVSQLKLDSRAKDKLRRLVGERYDEETDLLTIVADRCPVRKQNLEYAMYLLTASCHESWHVEQWEAEKCEEDMEYYLWERNASKRAVIDWHLRSSGTENPELSKEDYEGFDLTQITNVDSYKSAVSDLINKGESDEVYDQYQNAVLELLGVGKFGDHVAKVEGNS